MGCFYPHLNENDSVLNALQHCRDDGSISAVSSDKTNSNTSMKEPTELGMRHVADCAGYMAP